MLRLTVFGRRVSERHRKVDLWTAGVCREKVSKMTIEGIKLIQHNMGGVNNPDDPAYGQFRLDASFRVPSFMEVAATFIYGREVIVVRGKTREALEAFVKANGLDNHPRLQKLEITEPEKVESAAPKPLPPIPKPEPERRRISHDEYNCGFYGSCP